MLQYYISIQTVRYLPVLVALRNSRCQFGGYLTIVLCICPVVYLGIRCGNKQFTVLAMYGGGEDIDIPGYWKEEKN